MRMPWAWMRMPWAWMRMEMRMWVQCRA
jgi:hypothetical protein